MYLYLVGRLTPCFSCFSCFSCFKLVGGCVAGDDVVFRWMMVKWLWSSGVGGRVGVMMRGFEDLWLDYRDKG